MKNLLALFFLIACTTLSFSQEITVLDAETGEPVMNVYVTAQNGKDYKVTGPDGKFSLDGFGENDLLRLTHIGYESKWWKRGRDAQEGAGSNCNRFLNNWKKWYFLPVNGKKLRNALRSG
ncbi:carboxypeptidase-like regulatory domain-containing protein [Robertkochia flava]|uniref:carboxypeptidase-like regulatory domain-containing protein n=1 Tax=Robertkochia flava TaxID=3447986 RepID=UPI001CCDF39B|nr:carboxypeptidase-like regulatory domain-containing protein [Robertkochia marina]